MMITKDAENLLAEIPNSQGFINIDTDDVEAFKARAELIDAEKVSGRCEEIGVVLNDAISSIRQRNAQMHIARLLFVIRTSKQNDLMNHISDVHDVVGMLGEGICCQWGIATFDEMEVNQFELILAVGFIH